jgi:subtilase family serine protease
MTRLRTSVTAVVALTTLAAAGMMSAPTAQAATRHKVSSTSHAWVGHAKSLGRPKASKKMSLKIYLAPSGGIDALKSDVAKISDPKSSSYRKFLSAAKYHATYDASSDAVSRVSSWLTKYKLRVTSVEAQHRYIAVTGTVAKVESAFKVSMKSYKHSGHTVMANTKPASVPAGIAPYVATITGLDTTPHKITHQATSAPPSDGFRNARPCSRAYGQVAAKYQADFKTPLPKFKGKTLPYAVCGYTGAQLRGAYENNLSDGKNGAGVTVAITDAYASPTIVNDIGTYTARHGDGSYAAGQYSQRLPGSFNRESDCDPSGWYGEQTLDIEAVHAMAPGAKIRYYASASCYDDNFLTTLRKVVDENKASLVSNSWGDLEQNESADSVFAYEQIFLQGAMQGVGFLFSSGDDGDELASSGLRQTDYPASDPYVTAVGGTADAIGADGTFTFQTGWGTHRFDLSSDKKTWTDTGFLYGAGGGESSLFNKPSYQSGVVPARYGAGRAVPDVGLDADPTTGMLVGQTQTFPDGVYYDEYRIGGTSLASPLFAGMTAVTTQHAGGRLGFLNPAIYAQYESNAFTDIKGSPTDAGNVRSDYINGVDAADGLRYTVRTFNQDSSLAVAEGWDDVTGIGSPNAGWLSSIKPQKATS